MIGFERHGLAIPAILGGRQHPIADRQRGHPGSDRRHDAGGALAGDEGQRRHELIDAAHHEHIDIVDRCGMYLDENLARAGNRSGRITDTQRLGRAELFDDDGSHPLVLSGRRTGKAHRQGRQAALRNPLDQLSFDDLAACRERHPIQLQQEFGHLEAGQAKCEEMAQ